MPTFLDRIRAFAAPASLPQPGAGEGAPVAYVDPFRLWAPKTRVYNPSLIVGRKGLVIYDEMRRDDQVKAALEFKKRSALSTTWQVHPADPESKEDKVADFVKTQFEDMAGSFNTSLWEVMTALDYGYSVTEKVFESDGDTINLKKLSTVQPRSITFEQGRDGEITAMHQANNDVVLDPAKFLIYSYQARFANAYGTSDLEAAYRPWWAKDNAYRWLCMMLERFGIPPVAAIYNPQSYSPAQIAEIQGALSSLQANSYMTIPRGKPDDLEMWTPELAGQIQRAFIPAMDMFNGDIARSMLMPGLMGMTTDNQSTGSLARAQVHFDAFMLVVESIQDDIASILNDQLIPQLVDLNFPNVDGYPKFEFDPFTDDVRLDILTTWAGLVTQHAVTSGPQDEVHIRSLLKFPEREEVQQPVNEPTLVAPPDPNAPPLPGTPPPPTPPADPLPPNVPPKLPLKNRDPSKVIRLVSDDGSMSRVANQVEIDAGIDRFATMADDLDKAGLARMHTVLSDMEQKTLARLQSTGGDFTSEGIDQFDVAGRDALNGVTLLVLQDAYRAGRVSIRTQFNTVKTFATDPNLIPEAALNYLNAKAFQVSNVVSDRLQGQIKQTLLSGLKAGWTLEKTTSAIRDIFAPYTATESSVLVDSPWQLETIVRTNNTDALNQGRLIEARALPDGLVNGYLYSAIIDDRTCFASGTPVRLSNGGTKPIERIEPGEFVVSGSGQPRRVRARKTAIGTDWRKIRLADGSEVLATATHPFWTLRAGGYCWVESREIEAGDEVATGRVPEMQQAVHLRGEAPEEVLQQEVLPHEARGGLAGAQMSAVPADVQGPEDLCGSRTGRWNVLHYGVQQNWPAQGHASRGHGIQMRGMQQALHTESCSDARGAPWPLVLSCLPNEADDAPLSGMQDGIRVPDKLGSPVLRERLLSEIDSGNASGGACQGRTGNPGASISAGSGTREFLGGFCGEWHARNRGERRLLAFERSRESVGRAQGGSHQAARLALFEIDEPEAGRCAEGCVSAGANHAAIPEAVATLVVTSVETLSHAAFCYDLEVENDHSYLVGSKLIVHNTEVCQFLDEKFFPADSDATDLLAPPRHFKCRAVLIPVPVDQVTAQFTAITDADVLKAETLSGQGF